MRILTTIILALFFSSASTYAANPLRTAKENIRKGQKLDETANNLIKEAAKAEMRLADKVECWRLAAECSHKLYDAENTKLYLRQSYDTVHFYTHLLDMFQRTLRADSLSQQPDEKGRKRPIAAHKIHDYLSPYRTNLLNGGKWFYRHTNMKEAYRFLDAYVDVASTNAFAADSLAVRDTLMPQAAYLAVAAARSADQPEGVVKHGRRARMAGLQSHLIQEYVCRAYVQLGDTAAALNALYEGLHEYPEHPIFFSSLIDHYSLGGDQEKGLALADSMIMVDPKRPIYWYARSLVLLREGRDREAIDASDKCLELDPQYVDAYYNKGIASLNLAMSFAENACTDLTDPRCLRDREILRSLYQLAKQPLEKVRELAPEDSSRWAAPLYRIYLHLNMGKEFDEMDRILKKD